MFSICYYLSSTYCKCSRHYFGQRRQADFEVMISAIRSWRHFNHVKNSKVIKTSDGVGRKKWSFVKKGNENEKYFMRMVHIWAFGLANEDPPERKYDILKEDELHMCVIYYVCKGRYLTEEFVLT